MRKFSLLTLLFAISIVALLVGLVVTRSELAVKSARLKELLQEMRFLDIDDPAKINAISIPGFGQKSWRWRLHLPPDRRFRIRVAFDDIPAQGLPVGSPDRMVCELPGGESILTASIVKNGDGWGLSLFSESDGQQNFDFVSDIQAANTKWLAKRGGCSQNLTGHSTTVDGNPNKPFILVSYRDGISPTPGVVATNPAPTDGVLIWIQEMEPNR